MHLRKAIKDRDVIKNKWKNLRDAYRRECKKVKVPRSGDPGPSTFEVTSTWLYFMNMQFMKDQMLPAKILSNLEEAGSHEDTILELSFVEDAAEPQPERVVSPKPVSKKSRMSNDLRCQRVEIEHQKCGFMHQLMNNRSHDMEFFLKLSSFYYAFRHKI
ncbi:hypothetical protein FKM82_030920 [Ascaphus truei]